MNPKLPNNLLRFDLPFLAGGETDHMRLAVLVKQRFFQLLQGRFGKLDEGSENFIVAEN